MTLRSWIAALGIAVSTIAAARGAHAAPVWVGDMETGDLSQWEGQLNGEHITVETMPVLQGMYAAHIELTNDAVWPNGLKRVELHHSPAPGRTAEGKETWFAWSFYLPDTLPTDPSQEIGYWESNQSYQQMMAFDVDGEHISFATRKPQNKVHWEADGKVTADAWHRIAIHVKWSKDAAQGSVDVWFDGEQVVTQGGAQTLADDNDHFTQVGLLRGQIEFQDAPVILIDDAVEGDSVDDVHPELPGQGGGGAGGTAGGGTSAATGGSAATSGVGGQGGAPAGSGGVGNATRVEDPPSDDGCGCRLAEERSREASGALAGIAAAILLLARRRRPLA